MRKRLFHGAVLFTVKQVELITMQDLAEAAGVSRMTVSFALRNSPEVSAATRQRIQELAEKRGYRPDPLLQRFAVQLQERRRSPYSGTIGYLIDNPSWQSTMMIEGKWRDGDPVRTLEK